MRIGTCFSHEQKCLAEVSQRKAGVARAFVLYVPLTEAKVI